MEVSIWNRKEELLTEDIGIEGKSYIILGCVLAAWREEKNKEGAS